MTFCARRQEKKRQHTHTRERTQTRKPVWKEEEEWASGLEWESENITTSASSIFARLCFYYILRHFFCCSCRFVLCILAFCVFVLAITITYVHVSERGCDCLLHVGVCVCVHECMYVFPIYFGMCACLLMARVGSPCSAEGCKMRFQLTFIFLPCLFFGLLAVRVCVCVIHTHASGR